MLAGTISPGLAPSASPRILCWNSGLDPYKLMKTSIVAGLMMISSALAFAQTAPPAHVAPTDAKNHLGETATICGKVVDTKVSKYGIGGHGKPVNFDLDQPEPNPVFYFVAFGKQPDGPDEAIAAYKGKQVCVTGKIASTPSGPYIMAADRTQIKVDEAKPDAK
jgi:hypothetical protein